MNRWNPSLRPFLLLAALASLALPARADTLFYGGDNPWTIETGSEWTFDVIREDVSATRTIAATSSSTGVVRLKSGTVTLSRETANRDGDDVASFTLVPVKPGTATITVSIRNDADPAATISFDVVVTGNSMENRISFSPDMVDIDEGISTNRINVTLGSPAPSNIVLQLTLDGAGTPADHVTVPATITIPRDTTTGSFRINALDGDYDFTITATDPDGYFRPAILQGSINNVNPVLHSPNDDPESATVVKALSGAPFTFSAIASDVATDDDENLVYHWTGSTNTTADATITVHSEGEQVRVYATDNDGGRSQTGYFVVEIADSGRLLFTDVCTLSTIVAGGGNGMADFVINPGTTRQDDASQPWDEVNGNNFYSPGSAMVQPILAPGTYPFGWQFPDDQTALASTPSDLYIPNPSTAPILIKAPEPGGAATIRYFSSNPYKDFWNERTGARIDDFGDFDQDGLSDIWENWYLDGGQDRAMHSFLEWQTLAVTVAKGLYGSSGTTYAGGSFYNEDDTPDNDRVPTARYEEIDNAWAGDPNIVTNEDAVNKVRAFLYPLPGNYVDYGTHVGEDVEFVTANGRVYGSLSSVRSAASKPFFSNILEFRGLQQTSSEISLDVDKAPNWVAYGYPGILSRTNLNVRGNSPGTDPTVADTDADGREDGWEYYFWSTILYENKPEYWRAYDPTLALYPQLSPGGSANFRATGFPLLRKEGIEMTLVTNGVNVRVPDPATGTVRIELVPIDQWDDYQAANPGLGPNDYFYSTEPADDSPVLFNGGLFVQYPDQEFEVELIRSECFYGNPVLDPTTRSGDYANYLTNYPVASVPYYDVGQDPDNEDPTPAVVFTIGNFVVYTRDGYVDAQGRAKLFFTPFADDAYNGPLSDFWTSSWPTALEPGEIPGAYVDFLTGSFYLPGYDFYPPQIQALIGDRNARARAHYRTMNGLFPKAWLLNQFDPNDKLAPNVSDPDFNAILKPLGLSTAGWNPAGDLDGDGLSDLEEYYLGTNPIHWDNDNDGLPDGWEVLFGLDPHDATDAGSNPDCDRMFAVGPYRHADAFLYHYFNETFWNGHQSLGFVPGAASAASLVQDLPFTSREEFYMQKWMMGKAGRNMIFLSCIYPMQWLDANGRCIYTTNPRNDDSNEDHIPDGWALYAGYIPVPGVDLIDHVWGPLHDFLPPICPDSLRGDPDGDGLGWRQEYENWMMSGNPDANLVGARESQIANNVYVEEEQDSFHEPSWYTPTATRWTNKLRPTSPWLADTDGDGLSDSAEYMEGDYDWNGDGDGLANFNPTTADTRFDRLPDSWHYLTGLYDTTNAAGADLLGPFGPYGDPDGDGLPNYQEYLAGAVYAWRYDKWYSPDNESIWQPDPQMPGYSNLRTPDADMWLQAVRAGDARIAEKYSENPILVPGKGEARRMNPDFDPDFGPFDEEGNDPGLPFWEDAWPYGKSVHFQPYRPADFFRAAPSPHSVGEVVRTIQVLEARWVNVITNIPKVMTGMDGSGNPIIEDGEPHVASGWDELYSPTLNDLLKSYDDPTFVVSPIANYIQRAWSLLNDRKARCLPDVDPITGEFKDTAFISVDEYYILQDAIGVLQDYSYSYGARPAPWEPAPASKTIQYVDADLPVVWRFMVPNFVGAAGFPTCMPRNPDSDNDGMDDYWEIYHGLNPLYGGSPSVGKAGARPDSDRADRNQYGNGSTRDWIMAGNPTYVRVLTPTEIGLQPIKREDAAFHTPLTGMPIAEAAHFDYLRRPWLAGDRFADPDQDGLSNQEESYNYLLNDVLHHTDPSPYWFADTSYAESYVNLYYKVDGELATLYWWWDEALLGTLGDGPTYLFDFEMGEGFDTDNDNISDREELTQSDNSGVTDPQDLDSPRNRKALYFDGNAAARTRNPYYHDKFTLTSYTVEFWVRPEALPAAGRRQTLVQRPVLMPVDDSSGASHWQIRHTFLIQIDHLGQVHGRVDNDALETLSSATVVSAGRLVPGKWAHVALVMDSVADRFTLYINGEYAGGVGAGLKPCTGGLFGFQWQSPTGIEGTWENANLYDYSPAPIVLGAYDRNPWGVVGGPYETYPWGWRISGSIAGQNQPEFDPDQFFTGWMDEVRIWDRCRSQSEIKNWMMKRVTKEDIQQINGARLAWELKGWEPDRVGVNLVAATTQSDFPQKLLYHYAFDNLPDTVGNGRDTSFADYFGQDAWPFPAGWQSATVSSYRPSPFWTAPWWYHYADTILPNLVPWWYASVHRSNVYSDYSYVPWIENTVAHMPQTPALDMKGLFPNWNTDTWTVSSYRYRSTLDWENDAMIASDFVPYRRDDIVPAALPAAGSTDVQLSQIRNTMNPYVMFYRTGLSAADETNPSAFAGKLDTYGRYTGIPVLSDMLPLLDAVADIDVPMWDGRGRGTEIAGVDTDGDGLPDWWEIAHGLDPNDGSGANGAYGDSDSDGLDNWAEYLAGTDPFAFDTDSDGYSDYYSRPDGQSLTYGEMYDDGDGMDNVWEIAHGLDPNRYDATDDSDGDGWTNWEEFMAGTSPEYSDQYPEPTLNVEFHYTGENWADGQGGAAQTFVQAYGEKTAGPNMGGWYDGLYRSYVQELSLDPLTSSDVGTMQAYGLSWSRKIAGEVKRFTPFDQNYYSWESTNVVTGNFIYKLQNEHIGSATVTYSTGTGIQTSVMTDYDKDSEFGLVFEDVPRSILVVVDRSKGVIYTQNAYVYSIEYSVGGRSFPILSKSMSPVGTGTTHDHMASGWNRFLGFLDSNGDKRWSPGEPMGLSQPRPTLVSWDAVETTIPLADSVWDYPRVEWEVPDTLTNGVSASDLTYFVTFEWKRGANSRPDTSTTGDTDGDGLEDWMEALAGTDPNSTNGVPNDYYAIDPATGLFYGELYDDGDGMPFSWEVKYGLDPQRFDGMEDFDDDGWSNWSEFLAGTDPSDADRFPEPSLDVTFRYSGDKEGSSVLKVQSYAEMLHGRYPGSNGQAAVNMAGTGDGLYTTSTKLVGSFGMPYYSGGVIHYYIAYAMGVTFDVSDTGAPGVRAATLSFTRDGQLATYELQEYNEEYGVFVNEDPDHIFFEYETGYLLTRSGEKLTEDDDLRGRWYTFEYTPSARAYPFTVKGMNPVTDGGHMVAGRNRFLGYMDLNSDDTWDAGEPMGISAEGAVLAGWDSVATEIALTDSLWDYPRISWEAEAAGADVPADGAYYVTFTWNRGVSAQSSSESFTAVTGDTDGDGLEDWMEALAGTDPASTNGVPNDYYSIDPATGLFHGELYDDGDGMPEAWETRYGLDPYRFDATRDRDDDGWSNWAEFMAGTNPSNADDFPEPSLDVTFRYNGTVNGSSVLKVQSYGEFLHGLYPGANGSASVNMAGTGDALYTSSTKLVGTFGMPFYSEGVVHYYIANAMGVTFDVSDTGAAGTRSATLSFYRDGSLATYELQEFNDEYGYFVDDDTDHIFFEYETGYMLTRSGDKLTEDDQLRGRWYTFEYTPSAKSYPFTVRNMTRNKEGYHTVEGRNRFLGFMDLNSDGAWNPGEPMGLSTEGATLVGWDSAAAEIVLTDSLWDYPRLSWASEAAAAEPPADGAYYVTFEWDRGVSSQGGVASYAAITGDTDGDGLEDWMEDSASTDPASTNGVPNDYYAIDPATGLMWGELYDDGDGLPSAWEMRYGIDPYRFDAQLDLDDDGWSNWSEFMAGTDPSNPDDFPEPDFGVTFRYTGKVDGVSALKVLAYGARVHGLYPGSAGTEPVANTVLMGGSQDGIYTTLDTSVGLWNDNGPITALNTQWGTTFVGVKNISAATLLVYRDGQQVEYAATPFYENDDYGVFVDDAEARIFVEWATGLVMTQFYSDTQDADSLIDESGLIVKLGRSDHFSPSYRITFTTASESFPMQIGSLARDRSNGAGHMVEGPNRFLGLMDLDGDGVWDPGEPMGLSLGGATPVSWESVSAEIPLTDSVWGYPRVAWPAAPFENPIYYVEFTWVRGGGTLDLESSGSSYFGTTGDWDGDGLEDWMEALAGTSTNSASGDPSDYYAIDSSTGLMWGELLDDGDGMPTAWEMKFGLDPYRYDAVGDIDDDGWSNYAEFMAGTDPTKASSYPHPKLAATFYYAGQQTDLVSLGVYTYGQKTQGATWGGPYDGRYTSTKGFSDGVFLGSDGSVTLDEWSDVGAGGTFAVNNLAHGLIESASINVYVENEEGAMEVRQFQMTQINPGMGVFTQDDKGWILIEIESGRVLTYGDYVGKRADVHTTVKTYTFPVTFKGLIRNPEGNHTHMVEGPNRFFGWMDLDGNANYDQGEPMGLALYNPSLVGWDSTSLEIPLTDTLWDYPRVSWNDFVPTNFVPVEYQVFFKMVGKTTAGTITSNETSTTTTIGIYGDLDGDGLDLWAENTAWGNGDLPRIPHPNNPTSSVPDRLDYDVVDERGVLDADRKLTFGELLDDSDGMPSQWEFSFGLDPSLFDADSDLDDDGWSNYAEFLANTDPTDPDDYPAPQFDVTFRYDGEANGADLIKVLTYSERRQGTYLVENPVKRNIYMGGLPDGLYTTHARGFGQFKDAGIGEFEGTEFGLSRFGGERIGAATLTLSVSQAAAGEGNAAGDAENAIAAQVTYTLQPYNDNFGVFVNDGEAFILLEYDTGLVYSRFTYLETQKSTVSNETTTATVLKTTYDKDPLRYTDAHYVIEYSPSTIHYPFTVGGLQPAGTTAGIESLGAHDHMVEGYNRFLGWMDLNNDNTWNPGEPMGLSLYDATLVGWDSVVTEIPLTDELFGFPRIAWEAPTNMLGVTSYHVYITRPVGAGDDEDEEIEENAGPEDGIVVEAPRTFLHEGDYVAAGIKGLDLGDAANALYRYEVIAQNDSDMSMQQVIAEGEFRLLSSEVNPVDGVRRAMSAVYPTNNAVLHGPLVELRWKMDWRTEGVYVTVRKDGAAIPELTDLYVPFPVRHGRITDDDYYYSYIPQLKDGRSIVELGNGNYTWTVEENLNLDGYRKGEDGSQHQTTDGPNGPQTFRIESSAAATVPVRSVASIKGNVHYYGRLASEEGEFSAGPVVILAYRVSDQASSSLGVSGHPVAKVTQDSAGAFEIPDLEPGTYGLIAFVDRNGSGLPDVEETQGMGFLGLDRPSGSKGGGSADPIQLPEWFSPIRITAKDGAAVPVEDVHIVLRDRDLNGDRVPDVYGGAQADYKNLKLVTVPAAKPTEGPGTNWVSAAIFDPTFRPYSSRTVKSTTTSETGGSTTGEKEWGPISVKVPRTFLHEGDLVRLGTYGFDLENANYADFTWEVVATDGYHTQTNAGGEFSVFAGTDDMRSDLKLRWPIQNTVVHGSTVRFEWEMDERNAGVEFVLRNLDTGETLIDTVASGKPIAFPVRHWDPEVQCYYYTATPQMEDGLQFVSLPDGSYEYTITERPNTLSPFVTKKSRTERFQVRNAENTRITGLIEGDVRYYGRSMEAGTPPTWSSPLRIRAYRTSEAASSSASVGGLLVAESVQDVNGAFRLEGLKAGTYNVHAFVDSNTNGVADAWETQGFGVLGGTASPVVIPVSAPAIVVTNGASVVGVNIVLRDRDTDGDKIPDVWEWKEYGSLTAAWTGNEPNGAYADATREWSEGAGIVTNWDWTASYTNTTFIPETAGLRVLIDEPRTFLHEGDLLAPYELKDRSPGAADTPENRRYRLWMLASDALTGIQTWEPMDRPYYGFELGAFTNIDVKWTATASDGVGSMVLAESAFRVTAATDDQYDPLVLRYPVQNETVRTSVVQFEWKMDDRTAGVKFRLWRENGPDTADGELVVDTTIPLPVRHWDADERCYYWTARPQQEDGLRFLDLPDGYYRYEIVTRPQTAVTVAAPKAKTGRFRMAHDEASRVTGSIDGTIRYFGRSMEAGTPPTWPADLHLQARLVGDSAATSASVGGEIVSDEVRSTNGAFRVTGLAAGTYTILAFVDSNGNGIADDWETQGYGVFGGSASPVVVPGSAPPIIVTNGAAVTGVNVVLHDRDTDGDKLPDVWEWKQYGNLTDAWAGHEPGEPYAAADRTASEGEDVLLDWTWPIDWTQVIRRAAATAVKEALRVRVEAPRTFLHEGDFLAPYILRDRSPDATDEPANRFYRLWLGQEIGGVRTWIPQTEPYLGFDLGSHSNIVVTWTVETSDGSGATEIASGSFPVTTVTGEPRMPAAARYPIQNTTVRTAIVEFEWTMDEHNAGVVFSLWKTDGPDDEEGVPIATNRIVALPVRHWDAVKRCFYWTARPQLGDGIEVLDLEDGWYRYEITTCPRTDLVDTETISGRFRMAKTEGSRVTGSIDGTIRYFGRSMDASADPATWGDAVLHLQARKVGESATSSAMVGGALVADQMRGTNGAFRIDGLAAGTYTILAFVDSNGNGIADDWETQGYGVFGGSASPVVVPGSAPPIVVTNGAAVTGVNVVLHDRDTDGDRLPDVWEWSQFGNLATSGYDRHLLASEGLPDGFRLLEYVVSSGRQYVDTGISTISNTVSFDYVFENLETDSTWKGLVGARNGATAYGPQAYNILVRGDSVRLDTVGRSTIRSTSGVNTLSYTAEKTVFNGKSFTNAEKEALDASLLLFSFGTSTNGDSYAASAQRLYSCSIWDNGVLVRDFEPVVRADGVAGLFDRVSGEFFSSATETPLEAGPDRRPSDGDPSWWQVYAALPYSDPDALADWIWPIDWTQVLRGAAATAVKEALRVRVEAPRTFLHEGDLLAPYILRDRSPDAKDEPDNRLYRLWRGQEVDGVQTWIPQTEPYLGFNLGSHSNIVVTWTVEASDGSSSAEIATGSFPVRAEIGEARMPATSRYPVQNEKVRTSVVEFQWTMDECNAGVVFDVWKVSGPEGTKDDADAVQILTNRVVALPVRHWDAAKRCYYWTARPQQADGTEFVPLADGFYVYTIATRPQTDLVAPETISERFQMRTGEPSPTTASIAGTIRYFGRSMDANSVPPTWPADLHLQAWKVSSKAGSSASAGGIVYADEVRSTNGAFRVSGLPAGTYAIVAFVDSNGNGVADDWETQGFGTYGGSASPVVIGTTAYPISVTNGQELSGIHVVLHDRDTDNDLLPDVWEWAYTNSLTDVNGYMEAVSNAYVALTNSEPDSLSDWTWPTPADVGTPIVQDETESVRVRVDGPRTFLHEGDFMMPYVYGTRLSGLRALGYYAANGMPAWSDLVTNGVNDASFLVDDRNRVPYLWRKRKDDSPWEALSAPYYGFWLGSSSNVVVKWTVEAWDGADTTNVADGSFHVISTTGAQRKRLAARYPTQQTEIFGNVVEFEWEMDDHNAGVYFTLRKIAGEGVAPGAPVTVISNMVVAIPIRHGRDGIDGSYYSAVPQLDGGALYAGKIEGEPDFDRAKWSWTPDNGKTFIALPGDGLYEYTITERPQSDAVAPQTIVERFQLVNSGETRGLYDVSGSIRYYGKVMESEPVDGVDFAPNGDRTVWTATAPADVVVPGAMSVLVKDGEDVVEAFSDSQANGILYASGGTNSTAWSGTIDYESGAIEVRFSRALADGRTPTLAVKSFPAPLFLQAFRLPDEATTCVSVSGTPVYQEVRRAKGDFMVRNLEAGRYAIRAFLDSNGNGYCDEWETQGLAVQTGTVSPNLDPNAAPIVVADNVTGLMIVLHDRDTDNDLLPDAWEWWKAGGSLLTSGYESDEGGLEWWRQYADGVLDSDPRTPDTDLDGLTDAMEILVTQTDTHLRDTDGDGIGDLEEFLSGSDPLKASEAIPYTVPSIAFDGDGVPFVEISYPALRPGVTLTYELQRKESLEGDAWTTVGELPVANDGGAVFYSQYDGVNAHLSDPGTGVLRPEDQLGPDAIDLSTGFYRIKVFADYGRMVENADGTCSFWTWVRTGPNAFEYKEAARGKGKLVRDADGNWSFVSDATGRKGVLVRGEDGTWTFQE